MTSSNSNPSGFQAYSISAAPHASEEEGRGNPIQAERACAKRSTKWHTHLQAFWHAVNTTRPSLDLKMEEGEYKSMELEAFISWEQRNGDLSQAT